MFKFTTVLIVVGSAFSARPENFRTLLTLDEKDNLFANVTVVVASSPLESRTVRAKLNDGVMYVVATGAAREGPATLGFACSDESLAEFFRFQSPRTIFRNAFAASSMGIGASSALVEQVGAVAVIKSRTDRRAQLVIGSTLDDFVSTCEVGTIMMLDFASGSVEVTASLIADDGESTELFGDFELFEYGDGSSNRARVPADMYTRIEELLIARGSVRMSETISPARFAECSAAVIASLPAINFNTAGGSIVYHPEDYIEVNTDDNTCTLRILRAREGVDGLEFNPLLLVDSNVRVTRDNVWQICDSSATL
jgi:hypothetical protein